MNSAKQVTRRAFIHKTVVASAGLALASNAIGRTGVVNAIDKPNSLIDGVQIGVTTYSFMSMLDVSAEAMLTYCVDSGINAIELQGGPAEVFAGSKPDPVFEMVQQFVLSGHRVLNAGSDQAERAARLKELAEWRASAPMTKFEQLRKMYAHAGVTIYAWRPNALGENNTDAEIDYAFRAAKTLGASHVTLELPTSSAQTLRLSKYAARHNLFVGYHGHLQQTPTLWDTAIQQSTYNGLNCDLGHYVSAGYNPVDLITRKHDRIWSAHLKDRSNKQHGSTNEPWGRGDTPIVDILQTVKKNKYTFPLTIELEYAIPDGSNAVKEVQNCLEYCIKSLKA